MSSRDDTPMHQNLADALDDDALVGGLVEGPDAAGLDALARRLSDLGPDAALDEPPPGLFAAIDAARHAAAPEGTTAPAPRAKDDERVVALEPARRIRRPVVLAVLGAAAAVVVAVTTVAIVRDDDPAPTTEQVALEALPGFEGAVGSATVVIDGEVRSVGVDLSDVDVPPGSHLELWLLDEAVEELVPLGPVTGTAPHAIPAEVDLAATPIVDISLEKDDGNPAHSGVSVARGRLEPA